MRLQFVTTVLTNYGRSNFVSKLPRFYAGSLGRYSTISLEKINFEDPKKAFRDKSTSEILRSYLVLKICSYDVFVNNSLRMMTGAEKFLGTTIVSFFLRPTFYDQFVAGDNRESMSKTINRLNILNIRPMIACMMEEDISENETQKELNYSNNLNRVLICIDLLNSVSKTPACLQVKPTGFMSPNIIVKLSKSIQDNNSLKSLAVTFSEALKTGKLKKTEDLKVLSDKEVASLHSALARFSEIGKASVQKNVRILFDAEFISMKEGLNALALAMMNTFNKDQANIWTTVQCYLKSASTTTSNLIQITKELNIPLGLKIVRGAYMEQEKQLAEINNYPDPINDSYAATGVMYNRVVDMMLQNIKKIGPKCEIVVATHNEDGIKAALRRIEELKIDLNAGQVNFAQLYGMCEQVTIPLAMAGAPVYKSIPYGTLSETFPYLYRRATENRAVFKGARKERQMLLSELRYRIWK